MRNVERILLVDDDEDFALLLRTAFDSTGFKGEILVVADPAAALAALNRCEDKPLPDLVLLDLRLHRGSGFDVLRSIRSRPELNAVPVRVLTGIEANGDAQKAYQLGAQEYLVKPLEFSRLVEVAEHLRGEAVASDRVALNGH